MKVSIFHIFLILCFYGCANSQPTTKFNELTKLSIADTNLPLILDSVIFFEKRCDYYSDSLFFTVDVRQLDEAYELQVESSYDMNSVQDYFKPIFGYLFYKNHLFIVYDLASEKFFSKTGGSKKFKYIKYDKSYQREDGLTLYHIIDDSYTYWNYWYVNDRFIYKGKSSSCN